jgi:hypothetical protein
VRHSINRKPPSGALLQGCTTVTTATTGAMEAITLISAQTEICVNDLKEHKLNALAS